MTTALEFSIGTKNTYMYMCDLCINQFPGMGHLQFYRGPGGWALAYPWATAGHLTHVFSKDR